VGKNTVLLDNPQLNSGVNGEQPIRVVLDRDLEIPLSRRIFHAPDRKVIVVASEKSYKRKFASYDRLGIGLLAVPLKSGRLDLTELLKRLGEMGISSLLVEGGGETAARFLEEGLVDKVYFFLAPKIFGGAGARTSVEGAGIRNLRDAIDIGKTKVLRFGQDLLVVGYPQYPNGK
jgi:diaminohydroxyphosphoribosylaminopyrimidine deaminase/5-amino-6-(5-phosphoribosylamino)uracil reductase